MGKPSVGLICDLPEQSGIGKYGVYLQRLLQNEFDIEVLYFNYEKRCLEVIRGKERRVLGITFRFSGLDTKPWFWQRLKKLVPQYDLRHIISQNLSFLVPKEGNTLVTCHDIAPLFIPAPPWERWGRRMLYSGLKRAKMILSDSESTRQDLIRAYHIPSERMKVIPLGVDGAIFKPLDKKKCREKLGIPAEAKVILNVAIDKWRKNLAGLVRAVAMLTKEIPETLFYFAGTPSPKTLDLVRTLGLGDNFRTVKPATEEKLVFLYNAADVFAFPSFYEGFGLPALEAMACGTPVVASNRTSVPEIVGDAGIMIDPEDTADFARMIQRVLTEENLVKDLSKRGRERATQFSWEKTTSATSAIYKSALVATE